MNNMTKSLPDNTVYCDICKNSIKITKDTLIDEEVWLEKEGISHKVVLTYLICPACGKRYPVIMDDEETLPVLKELREALKRRFKFVRAGKSVPQRLEDKYNRLNRKLDFKRQKLSEKFDGALYQSEGNTIQLDYRYHAR